MTLQQRLRKRIKDRCRELGTSLTEVGTRMQKPISQASVSAMLSNDANPSIHKIAEIAHILDIPLSMLVEDDDKSRETPDASFSSRHVEAARSDLSSVEHHKTDINSILKASIKSKGFSLAQVASQMRNERGDSIGISQPALSNMLKASITFERVEEICNIIGVPLSELIAAGSTPNKCCSQSSCPVCGATLTIQLAPVAVVE